MFSTNDTSTVAAEPVTNREGQWQAFSAALGEHLEHTARPDFDVQDLEAPRRNVIAFFGVGGIGKSTLARTIDASLADPEQRPTQWPQPSWLAGRRILPVRIDLASSAGADLEQIVLTLRLALARHVGRPMPAFDLALHRYWSTVHPGEPLEEYLQRSGLAGKFGRALPGQVKSAISEAASLLSLPGVVGTAAGRVTVALARALRERHRKLAALAGCHRLADLLEAEPGLESLSYYPHLLAWELTRLPTGKATTLVVVLDTFEAVGDRTYREAERLLQHLVWLMPNALFVICGRNRLQWADEALAGQLDYTGPTAWPGLAARAVPAARTGAPGTGSGPRQVLIGDFSMEDAEDYLKRRLTDTSGAPTIPAAVRETIAQRSHGLPLHLDLAVQRYLALQRAGRTPGPADFETDFAVLVARTLQDLTGEERQVLRAASLLDAFDLDLATRTAGLTRQAAAHRLAERPLVRHDPLGIWPYHLHALVASTLRTATDRTDDAWAEADWHQAAARALAALGDQWSTRADEGRRVLVACLRQGLRLARDHALPLGWLADGAWAYIADSVWEPLDPPAPAAGGPSATSAGADGTAAVPLDTAAEALVEVLSAVAGRQREHRDHTVERLTAVLDTGLLPEDLADLARYYRAKAQRDLGHGRDSYQGMRQVADGTTALAPRARRGLAHLARIAGDLPAALTIAQQVGWEGRQQRIYGDLWWLQGDMDQAAAAYRAGRAEAEQHAVAGEQAICQAQLALVTALADPAAGDAEIALAEQLLTGLNQQATTLTVRTAALLRDAGTSGVAERAQALRAAAAMAGLTAVAPTIELAAAFHHAVTGDHTALAAVEERLRDLTAGGDYAYYRDIMAFMADREPATWSGTAWLDSADMVRTRWRTLVTTRQQHLRDAAATN
ncbi:ATP/GTP-binding protein [Kitasatospora sp. NPDC051984]|uniref:ATP/GTP-binding protein n=1 Tax=Kitasatospora sp. NPDC051984 TaxID=3364059 RepID=UPI0037C70063